jgi:hypothetical protein
MSRNKTIIGACLGAALGLGSLGSAAHSATTVRRYAPPPESYLKYSVYSVSQLIQELKENPSVRERYARHFQIPEDQVVRYMQDNLVESWVPQTRTYTVYCVSPSGKFFPIKQRFRKGTKVFALRNGEPVLKWICGNPLSRTLPVVLTKNIVKKPVTKVSPYLQELTPSEDENVLVPNEALAPVYQPLIPLTAGGASLPFLASGGSGGFPALFLLPAALLFSHGGGGGGGTTTAVIPPPPAVPEPGAPTMVLAALPVALLIAARRRRKDF